MVRSKMGRYWKQAKGWFFRKVWSFKTKDVLKKFGRSILRSTPTTKIAGVISDLRNREKKADFQKGDYSDISVEKMAKGGRAGLKGGGICKRGMNRKAVGKNS